MSSAAATAARVAALRELAAAERLDALLITSPASIYYLTGLDAEPHERLYAVALTATEGALIVPALERESAERAPTSLQTVAYPPSSDGFPELADALGSGGGRAGAIGVEQNHLSLARSRRLDGELRDAENLIAGLRQRKDAAELEAIRASVTIVAAAIERMFARLAVGTIERAVNATVAYELARAGATDSHPLILFGPNAARPHATPCDRALEPGDVICADVSARIGGYWGDLTRCGSAGPPSDWTSAAWEVVRDAQSAALDAARAGASCDEIDAAQRALITGAPQLGDCLHGAGHALGIEIHEAPFLVPDSSEALAVGNVLTIEPGIYAQGRGGIRLEDDIAVTEGAPRMLSDARVELRIV